MVYGVFYCLRFGIVSATFTIVSATPAIFGSVGGAEAYLVREGFEGLFRRFDDLANPAIDLLGHLFGAVAEQTARVC